MNKIKSVGLLGIVIFFFSQEFQKERQMAGSFRKLVGKKFSSPRPSTSSYFQTTSFKTEPSYVLVDESTLDSPILDILRESNDLNQNSTKKKRKLEDRQQTQSHCRLCSKLEMWDYLPLRNSNDTVPRTTPTSFRRLEKSNILCNSQQFEQSFVLLPRSPATEEFFQTFQIEIVTRYKAKPFE